MPPRAATSAEPGPLELIEEAVALLRAAPAATLLSYYLGALPFVFGLLWFWVSLSSGSDASRRLPAAALGLALLFAWMKTWQAVFARQLLGELCGDGVGWPGWREFLRLATTQLIVQSASLFLLPLALVLIVTFPHTCACFQSATALASRQELGTRDLLRRAAREAFRWPGQNVRGLLILVLFGGFVFLNVTSGALLLPHLLKMLLGIESDFTRSSATALNPTTLVTLLGLTWLCLDPILKAFYVLRCFHGDALRTGQDLRAGLRRLAAAGAVALALVFTAVHSPAAEEADSPPSAAKPAPASLGQSVPATDLDRAIRDTLNRPEYDWRPARERTDEDRGWLLTTLDDFVATLRDWMSRFWDWLTEFLRKLFRLRSTPGDGGSGIPVTRLLLIALVLLLAAVVAVALVRLLRTWNPTPTVTAQPVAAVPDLNAEDVHAGQLPADGWSRLAAELLDRGEFRLALRARYLASLALLAERGLLTLARFKSNRDYQRELDRRAHALPGLAGWFAESVGLVDRVWYGRDEVGREAVERFARTVEEMRGQP